jgi:nitrate/nitrite transport system ATP-binding protein
MGTVTLNGKAIERPGPERAVIFQSHSLWPWLAVYENVRLGLDKVVGTTKLHVQRDARVMQNRGLVQLTQARDKRPGEISGGMKQRIGTARAFSKEPKILFLDEPLGALDALTRAHLQVQVMDTQKRLENTVMMITHDAYKATLLADRIVMMTNGPAAVVSETLDVPLQRPRDRLAPVEDSPDVRCWATYFAPPAIVPSRQVGICLRRRELTGIRLRSRHQRFELNKRIPNTDHNAHGKEIV